MLASNLLQVHHTPHVTALYIHFRSEKLFLHQSNTFAVLYIYNNFQLFTKTRTSIEKTGREVRVLMQADSMDQGTKRCGVECGWGHVVVDERVASYILWATS